MTGVILPTRGLVYTRVEEVLEDIRRDHEIRIYRSHDLPIPEGHNRLSKQALLEGCKDLWFVEEDTVPPTSALEKLLAADSAIACIDYGVAGWGCVAKSPEGEILWCGLGCTLVKAEVFKELEYPYFRTDKVLSLNDGTWKDLPADYLATKNYGSLDIWFCTKAREKGFKIAQIDGECDHLRLDSLGLREVNNGLHQISLKPKVTNHQILKEVNQ